MCLAIYKPADTAPDWGAYENGMDANPDGWGFAVIDNGELLTACGMGGFNEFRRNFEPFSHCQSIIHFRWATHGKKDESNCHPFFVKDLAVIHNGVISIDTKSNEDRSDTWHFVTKVLSPMYERDRDFFTRPDVVFNMELAHSASKFVFLRQDGTVSIWNEEEGTHAADGHWYSNDGYLPCRYYWSRTASKPAMANCTTRVRDSWSLSDDEDEAIYRKWKEESGYGVEDEADSYDKAYYEKMEHDLMAFGFTRETVDEVFGLLGGHGLEALYDIL